MYCEGHGHKKLGKTLKQQLIYWGPRPSVHVLFWLHDDLRQGQKKSRNCPKRATPKTCLPSGNFNIGNSSQIFAILYIYGKVTKYHQIRESLCDYTVLTHARVETRDEGGLWSSHLWLIEHNLISIFSCSHCGVAIPLNPKTTSPGKHTWRSTLFNTWKAQHRYGIYYMR